MKDELPQKHALTGYLVADAGKAGFAVPVFQSLAANRPQIQVIGTDGRVSGFKELADTSRLISHIDGTILIAEGKPALWAFVTDRKHLHVLTRPGLEAIVAPMIDDRKEPFLQLQIAQFCGLEQQFVRRWRATFRHMDDVAPRSAVAWRDIVIIPASVRAAVLQAAAQHGLTALVEDPQRTVSVVVNARRIMISLAPELHEAFSDRPAALKTLRSGTRPLREAFNLRPDVIMASEVNDVDQRLHDDRAVMPVVAIGSLAVRVVRHNLTDERSWNGTIRPIPDMSDNQLPIIVVGASSTSVDERNHPTIDLPDDTTLFILLEVTLADPRLVDAACRIAHAHRRPKRRVIAVVPHLPTGLLDDEAVALWNDLLHVFDAVWALSDISPHTRQSLSYGGGHSQAAVARRFLLLLTLAHVPEFPLANSERKDRGISLLATAIGRLSPLGLLEHAMMKAASASLGIHEADLAVAAAGNRELSAKWLQTVIRLVAPRARPIGMRLLEQFGADNGMIAFIDVPIRTVDRDEMQLHCVEELSHYGWHASLDQKDRSPVVAKDLESWRIVIAPGEALTAEVLAGRWTGDRHELRFTEDTIGRRSFAAGVLFNAVPVNPNRIPVLDKVLRNRWKTALSCIRDPRTGTDELLVLACFARRLRISKSHPAESIHREMNILGKPEIHRGGGHVSARVSFILESNKVQNICLLLDGEGMTFSTF